MPPSEARPPLSIPGSEPGPPPVLTTDAWRRTLLALAVATMGVVDLLSALLSHPPDRLTALLHIVPTAVLDTSRTFTLLAGALLLITAWGLRRGKRRAFVGALFLCALSVPVNLLKAFDFEEATVAAALMFALGVSADAFRVRSRAWTLAALRSRAMWFVAALAIYAVGGCWLLELQHGPNGSLARAFAEVLYQLFGVGHPALAVPRGHRVVVWFLDSISVLGVTGLVGLALAALRPATHRGRHRAEAGRVAALLREHGDSSVSAFALADDSDYFFSRNGRAVIAYRFESDTLLAIGDPIGPAEDLGPLLRDFDAFCRDHDWQFAFFQARPERLPIYRALGWRALHIGEDPVLKPDRFTLEGSAVGDVRRMARKAEAAGIEVRHFIPGRDAFEPAVDPDGMLEQMRAISHGWLRAHHGAEKGFCMGRFDPHRLRETWLAVAWNARERKVEGFVTWVPVWARHGWALDMMRRDLDAATGTMELLVVRSLATARERGDAVMSLSLSALAHVDEVPGGESPTGNTTANGAGARSARAAAQAARSREFLSGHLARFYDFKGLFHWKKKFDPEFEDRYLIYADPLALPQVALALVRAQSPSGRLLSYLRNVFPARAAPAGCDAERRHTRHSAARRGADARMMSPAVVTLTVLTLLGGTVERVTMPAPALRDPHRTVRVYLPPSYFHPDAATRRYPVVYLLNGSPGSDGNWFGKGKAAVTVDTMIASGAIPEVILVCPNGSGKRYLWRSLYIDSYDGRFRMEEYIVRQVVAWTDSVYRTRAEPRDRAVIGLSDGATGAINLAFHHPDVFGACGAHSGEYRLKKGFRTGPALGPEPGRSRLLARNSAILEAPRLVDGLRSQTIYFDVGLSDPELEGNREFDRTLDSLGVAHTYHEFPGSHRWGYWRVHLHDSLLALLPAMR